MTAVIIIGIIAIVILIFTFCLNFPEKKFKQAYVIDGFICYFPTILDDVGREDVLL